MCGNLHGREGGIGVIHKNLTPEQQASEVLKVKKFEKNRGGPRDDPPSARVGDALSQMRSRGISGLPVAENGKVVGILTNRDIDESNLDLPVSEIMTREVHTAPRGTTLRSRQKRSCMLTGLRSCR